LGSPFSIKYKVERAIPARSATCVVVSLRLLRASLIFSPICSSTFLNFGNTTCFFIPKRLLFQSNVVILIEITSIIKSTNSLHSPQYYSSTHQNLYQRVSVIHDNVYYQNLIDLCDKIVLRLNFLPQGKVVQPY